jgi:DNA-damage-inducible protein J
MSRSSTYQIRIDADLKKQSFELFNRLGMTPAQVIKAFLTEAVNTQSIPLKMEYRPNAKTIQAIKEVEQGKDLVHCENAEDLFSKLGI